MKTSLLIGIRYEETREDGTSQGPHRDVVGLRKLLIERFGYGDKDIVIKLQSNLWSTRDNICMVAGAQNGELFFFPYSSHSSQVPKRWNSEEDVKHEGVFHQIDKLKTYLVPLGSRLVTLLDTCHSGSLLDLNRYRSKIFSPRGYRKTNICCNAQNHLIGNETKGRLVGLDSTLVGALDTCHGSLHDLKHSRRCTKAFTSANPLLADNIRDDVCTSMGNGDRRYRFKRSHLRFLSTFADVRDRPGWILPAAAKILVNVTPMEEVDTWRGQVEGSDESGIFLSSAVERV